MNDISLLKVIYKAIEWDKLFRAAPRLSREQVDEFFQRLGEALKCHPAAQAGPSKRSEGDAGAPASIHSARLYCDGASKGNPGPAGIGMILCATDGTEVEAWGAPIGRATNNVAEYRSLIEGLSRALELGVTKIEILSDSQLLIYQLTGRYKVKNAALVELHKEAGALLNRFDSWKARHIPRAENKRADKLATAQCKKTGKKDA